jgi:hypothetical protein
MSEPRGLEIFADRLHPDVVADIEHWRDGHPLAPLRERLEAHTNLKSFLDVSAEALVARHLLRRGCAVRSEVPTPKGRTCDFEVSLAGQKFYLNVKRLATQRLGGRRLTISSRLRSLERIRRPYVVSVRWREGASDGLMQRLVRSATDFITHARVGDELVVHDDEGREIGGILILAPWEGEHVTLAIGLPTGFIDETVRVRKLFRRAYQQFMPRATNVILICSSHIADREDVESALLGSHVERWDAFPPRGQRIAHGRADDGFWSEQRHAQSRAAGWFLLEPKRRELEVSLWFREEPELRVEERTVISQSLA